MKFDKRYGWGIIFAVFALIGVMMAHAQSSPALTLHVSPASLTVYLPDGVSVTPQELGFEVMRGDTTIDQVNLLDFPSFRSRLTDIQAPICFQLERSGVVRPPLPSECQREGVMVLSEFVNEPNAFWYDAGGTLEMRTVILLRGVHPMATCREGSADCHLTVIPPLYTPFPVRTSAPTATLDASGRNQDPLEMSTVVHGVQTAVGNNFPSVGVIGAPPVTPAG